MKSIYNLVVLIVFAASVVDANPHNIIKQRLTVLSCPGSDGSEYVAPSGKSYVVQCYNDHAAHDMGVSDVNTMSACIDLCDATPGCVAFSWASYANDFRSPCYLKSAIGTDQQNSGVWGGMFIAAAPTQHSLLLSPVASSICATLTTTMISLSTVIATEYITVSPSSDSTVIPTSISSPPPSTTKTTIILNAPTIITVSATSAISSAPTTASTQPTISSGPSRCADSYPTYAFSISAPGSTADAHYLFRLAYSGTVDVPTICQLPTEADSIFTLQSVADSTGKTHQTLVDSVGYIFSIDPKAANTAILATFHAPGYVSQGARIPVDCVVDPASQVLNCSFDSVLSSRTTSLSQFQYCDGSGLFTFNTPLALAASCYNATLTSVAQCS